MVLVLSLVMVLSSLSCMCCEKVVKGRGNRNPSAIEYDIYDALLLLINGDPLPPVKERSRAQKSAAIRLWRSKGQLNIRRENSNDVLFCKGRRILSSSEIKSVIADESHCTKGSGAKKNCMLL